MNFLVGCVECFFFFLKIFITTVYLFNLQHLNVLARSFSSVSSFSFVSYVSSCSSVSSFFSFGNGFHDSAKFVELLNSQQNIFFGSQGSVSLSSSQAPFVGSQEDPIIGDDLPAELPAERKERRMWTQTDDIVLISSWLNTSKDPIVGNEQKSGAFWKRIAEYFSASPKIAGSEKREASQCKQRWHKLNDLVCKFCGAYEAATRERTSGMNENDVLKLAHEIFFNNYQKKFTLEHAWKELRADQKWCELSTAKNGSSPKKGSVRMKTMLVEMKSSHLVLRVLRHQRPVERSRWLMGKCSLTSRISGV